MKDFGLFYSKEYRNGLVTVEHDGKKYYYEVKRGEIKEFKQWLRMNWDSRGAIATVTGAYPRYEVRYE